MNTLFALFFLAPIATPSPQASPQDIEPTDQDSENQDPENQQPELQESQEDSSSLENQFSQLKDEMKRRSELNENLQERIEELEQYREDQENALLSKLDEDNVEIGNRRLHIYGFFDVNFVWNIIDSNKSLTGYFLEEPSFLINRFNLYFSSQLSRTLSAIAEIRFTFLPLGTHKLDTSTMEYNREDTLVNDSASGENMRTGSIIIERIHFKWKPFDQFGIMAGRYLTPFGIWNIDHGSPIIIPVRPPFVMTQEALPTAQTGLQVFGRFFPSRTIYVDYAVTLSNGRGPTESVYDLDKNKALGVRASIEYRGKLVNATLGGYFYWGESTDVEKRVVKVIPPLIKSEVLNNSTEYVGSIDLLVKLLGLTIQSEFIRGYVHYSVHPDTRIPFFNSRLQSGLYQPDHTKWGTYGLIAYTFEINSSYGIMSLTPFAMTDYMEIDDSSPEQSFIYYRVGINFQPSPFFTLKYEAGLFDYPDDKMFEKPVWTNAVQAAVSF